jgi:excisionase family DNA binding protein
MAYETGNQKLLTVKETAELLRVSTRTIFNYIEKGLLKSVKVGGSKKAGKVLISSLEIERYLKEG